MPRSRNLWSFSWSMSIVLEWPAYFGAVGVMTRLPSSSSVETGFPFFRWSCSTHSLGTVIMKVPPAVAWILRTCTLPLFSAQILKFVEKSIGYVLYEEYRYIVENVCVLCKSLKRARGIFSHESGA